MVLIIPIHSFRLTAFVPQFYWFFKETRLTAFLHLMFWDSNVRCRDSNVYIKTAMQWFPRIQELTSPTFTSFIWQCFSFSVHSVLFIILKIILFACLNKELSLWWIFSYLVLLIGELENERSVTTFCRWQVNTYIHKYIQTFQKSERSRFVV